MPRILFDRSPSAFRTVRGEIIRKLQERLGFAGAEQDGVYGSDTQTALREWQSAHQVPATGAVDVDTWNALMQQPIPPIFDRSLQITAAFEGHGFTKLEGNFDGAGLTWGIIGFTWHNNQLQGIVRAVRTEIPAIYTESFGPLAAQLDDVLARGHAAQMAFANQITSPPGTAKVLPEWKEAFARLGVSSAVQSLQMREVKPAWDTAGQYFQRYGLTSEPSMALCFDIAVQIGIKPVADSAIRNAMNGNPPEKQLRETMANAVAETAKSEFVEDVRERKLTFARGQGSVHGDQYQLDLWGLGGFPLSEQIA